MLTLGIRQADVLVIGGGMAAAWAAISAAEAGASVIVVDKGAMGTSGVTASRGPGHWWVPSDPTLRAAAIDRQRTKAAGLGEPEWMERVLDLTWRHLPEIAPYYPFGSDGLGGRYVQGVRGPEYMRALRGLAVARGVAILDHHPALELIADADGAIGGARGVSLVEGDDWEIRAGAVVLATGGCAFRSGLIGSHGNTGDGLLMAAEAGAALSGMEFGPVFSLSPAWASTRTLPLFAARFFDAAGEELDIPPPDAGHRHFQALGAALAAGPVLADLADAPAALRGLLRQIQPLTAAAFERRGIDPFTDRFPVRLYGEGTIRGTGGLRIVDRDCGTGVPGLYAAGDVATRELVAGASSGGGAVNSAWALGSGRIAGRAAANRARTARPSQRQQRLRGLGKAGLQPSGPPLPLDLAAIASVIDGIVHGYRNALWKRHHSLQAGLGKLDELWREVATHARGQGRGAVELRSIAAMIATARWSSLAALQRCESRGLHRRADWPHPDRGQTSRLILSGLDRLETRFEAGHSARAVA